MIDTEYVAQATKEWSAGITSPKTYEGFPLGLKYGQDPRATPEGSATTLENLFFDRRGQVRYMGGSALIHGTDIIAEFIRFYHLIEGPLPSGVTSNEIKYLLAAKFNGFTSSILTINETTGGSSVTHTNLSLLYPSDACMIAVDGAVYCTQRDKRPLVTFDGVTWSDMGLPAPGLGNPDGSPFGITATAISGGKLDSSNTHVGYTWRYILVDNGGRRSNPSNQSNTIQLTNQGASFHINTADLGSYTSIVRGIELYRIGGTSSAWRLAAQISIEIGTDGLGNSVLHDSTTHTAPVDNTADMFLSDVLLTTYRDIPPRGLLKLYHWASRVVGAGQSYDSDVSAELVSPSRLWVSRLNEPEAFGQDDNGVDDDGGVVDIDGNDADWILDLSSTGGALIIGRSQSVYALTGRGFESYVPTRLSPRGVASRRSMVREGNLCYYLGNDGVFNLCGDDNVVPLSEPIQQAFDEIAEHNLASAVVWSHDKRIYISIPLDSGQMACYYMDLHHQVPGYSTGPLSQSLLYGWGKVTDTKFNVNQGKSIYPYGEGDPALYPQGGGRPECFVAPCGAGLYRVLDETVHTATPIAIESPYLYFGNPDGEKGVSSTDINGSILDFMLTGNLTYTTAPTVTITFLRQDGTEVTFSRTLRKPSGKMLWIPKFPQNFTGIAVKWKLTGTITAGAVSSCFVNWTPVRGQN